MSLKLKEEKMEKLSEQLKTLLDIDVHTEDLEAFLEHPEKYVKEEDLEKAQNFISFIRLSQKIASE